MTMTRTHQPTPVLHRVRDQGDIDAEIAEVRELSVLAGEQPATTGEVHVGGVNPHALSYEQRSRYLTLVEADSGVLSGTIEDNLRLARPDATGAELDDALRVAVLSGFVERST